MSEGDRGCSERPKTNSIHNVGLMLGQRRIGLSKTQSEHQEHGGNIHLVFDWYRYS